MRHGVYYDSTTPIATLSTGTSGSTASPVFLGQPMARFACQAAFSAGSSGTIQIRGALTSNASSFILLMTLDNTTSFNYSSTGIPVRWVHTIATTVSSGTTASIPIYLAAVPS